MIDWNFSKQTGVAYKLCLPHKSPHIHPHSTYIYSHNINITRSDRTSMSEWDVVGAIDYRAGCWCWDWRWQWWVIKARAQARQGPGYDSPQAGPGRAALRRAGLETSRLLLALWRIFPPHRISNLPNVCIVRSCVPSRRALNCISGETIVFLAAVEILALVCSRRSFDRRLAIGARRHFVVALILPTEGSICKQWDDVSDRWLSAVRGSPFAARSVYWKTE